MSERARNGGGRGGEDPKERVDRELIELLNELRVALPGVQVLFAFLLTVAFQERFDVLTATDRRVFYAAVLTAAAASVLLIAPTAHHRLRFRTGSKEALLRLANSLAIAGTACLALSVGAAVYVVSAVLYDSSTAGVVAGALTAVTLALWFVVPLVALPDASDEKAPPPSAGSPQPRTASDDRKVEGSSRL